LPQSPTTFLDELTQAARGCVALLTGNRQAATFFDFSQRGLIGSFIAFIVASTALAYGPQLFGFAAAPGIATRSLLAGAMVFLLEIGIAYLVLRQIGRTDGFVPFLVADNWAQFFISILSVAIMMLGGQGEIIFIIIGLVVIIVEINIARLIVTLAPLQIATFIIAKLVASSIGLLVLMAIMPETAAVASPPA
jgi:hypothetical protein